MRRYSVFWNPLFAPKANELKDLSGLPLRFM